MGVITLQGDAQAPLIENLLLDRLGDEEMEKRKLLVGKPYSFQGGERDIIFLSMVAARNQRIGTLTRATDQRRFNVAASRAKDQMWLFCSVELGDLSQLCLRKRLLEFFVNPASQITKALGEEAETLRLLAHKANRQIEKPPRPFDSWFEVDVALRIASRGFRVVPQYPIAGKRIDLVVEGEKTRLAVECYGDHWHGPDQYEKDMDRQRQLMRSGLRFHIIRECEFNANPDGTLERLWSELDYMHIHPVAASPVMQNHPVKTVRESETRESELSPESDTNARPNDIAGALAMKSSQLQAAIIAALKDRPNYSCVKDALSGFVLKHMGIRSRGKPRQQFSRKVSLSVKHLENDGVLKVYRSKNVRVKLISRET
jgi:very-short-patch-repair endonuclease